MVAKTPWTRRRFLNTAAGAGIGALAVCGPHLANLALRSRSRAVLSDDASRGMVSV